jgi:hypothetical protein
LGGREELVVCKSPQNDLASPASPNRQAIELAARPRHIGNQTNGIGHVDLPSGVLVVPWSLENGASVSDDDLLRGNGRPGGLVIDGSSLLTKLPPGRYSCFADMVRVTQGSALRCSVVPYGAQP